MSPWVVKLAVSWMRLGHAQACNVDVGVSVRDPSCVRKKHKDHSDTTRVLK